VGDGEKLLTYLNSALKVLLVTYLNSALKVLLGLDIFPRVPKKKLKFIVQCYQRSTCFRRPKHVERW